MKEQIRKLITESIAVKQQVLATGVDSVASASTAIIASLQKGGKVMLCGNGGSAADSQHIAAEFIGRFQKERKALAAIALTTDSSILTCLSNDYSYDVVFSRQVEGLGKAGDILIGISTSGKSANVIKAFEAAKAMGIMTIAFVGHDGGPMGKMADIAVIVPSKVTARVQESQLMLFHALCEVVEDAFAK